MGEWEGKIFVLSDSAQISAIDIATRKVVKRINITNPQFKYNRNAASLSAVQLGPYMFFSVVDSALAIYHAGTSQLELRTYTQDVSQPFYLTNQTGAIMSGNIVEEIRFKNGLLYYHSHTVVGLGNTRIACGIHHDGQLWLGGENGLFVVDSASSVLKAHYRGLNTTTTGADFIYAFRKDQAGNLLICTNTGGLYFYSKSRNRFPVLRSPDTRFNMIKCIAAKDAVVVSGQYGGGLSVYSNGICTTYSNVNEGPEFDHVWGVQLLDTAHVTMVTDRDVLKYNYRSGKVIQQFRFSDQYQLMFPRFNVTKDGYYINLSSGINSGLYVLNDHWQLDTILYLNNRIITTYAEVDEGVFIIGTTDGLYKYDSGQLRTLADDVWVKSVCITGSGIGYVGTTTGCYVFEQSWQLDRILTTETGMPDNLVYGVLEDDQNCIWMSTNRGIVRYEPKSDRYTSYTINDGLQSNEFNTGAYFKSADGRLYFGGVNGITIIDPKSLYINMHAPTVIIHKIMVADEPWHKDTAYNIITRIELPYNSSTISFDFAGAEFSLWERNTFRYRLEGLEEKWIESGTAHFARYSNLKPGEYVFIVQCANADGIWGFEKRIAIVVAAPYWQQSWFYFLEVFVLMLIIVVVIYLVRLRQQRKLQRELKVRERLEQERVRISRDLHDNVGAQLSYVISGLDRMMAHPEIWKDEDEFIKRLSGLSAFGRDAMLTLRETIWAISSKELAADDFADRFKQYVLRIMNDHNDCRVEFSEKFESEFKFTPESSLSVFRICQEAFHNCLKHANARLIKIQFISTRSTFEFRLGDDGSGFDQDKADIVNHYGLENMKARAAELKGTLTIQSMAGRGTEVHLVVPVQ